MSNSFLLGAAILLASSFYLLNSDNSSKETYELFDAWRVKYKKEYPTELEQYHRSQIFSENLKVIERLNAESEGLASFQENEYMDLSYSEFRALKIAGHNSKSH
jgi:hypothetical protein